MISINNLLLLASILCLSFVYLKKGTTFPSLVITSSALRDNPSFNNYILSEGFQRRAGFIPLVAAPSLQSKAPSFYVSKEGMRP